MSGYGDTFPGYGFSIVLVFSPFFIVQAANNDVEVVGEGIPIIYGDEVRQGNEM